MLLVSVEKIMTCLRDIGHPVYRIHLFITFDFSTPRRDGLMKMKAAYEANPNMGDPHTIEGQLTENGHKMEKLQSEFKKFSTSLAEVEGKPVTPHVQKKHRNSMSEESLSRSASDSSVGHNHTLTNNHNNQLRPNSNSSNTRLNHIEQNNTERTSIKSSTSEAETNG